MAENISAVRRSYFSCHARVCERTSERTVSITEHTDSHGDDDDDDDAELLLTLLLDD